jgi:hypothetical protein
MPLEFIYLLNLEDNIILLLGGGEDCSMSLGYLLKEHASPILTNQDHDLWSRR